MAIKINLNKSLSVNPACMENFVRSICSDTNIIASNFQRRLNWCWYTWGYKYRKNEITLHNINYIKSCVFEMLISIPIFSRHSLVYVIRITVLYKAYLEHFRFVLYNLHIKNNELNWITEWEVNLVLLFILSTSFE